MARRMPPHGREHTAHLFDTLLYVSGALGAEAASLRPGRAMACSLWVGPETGGRGRSAAWGARTPVMNARQLRRCRWP